MALRYANNATTILAAAISSTTATTLSVATGAGNSFPAISGGDYFLITLTNGSQMEIVKVTAVSGDVFTIVRGQESTTPQTFAAGTAVGNYLTAGAVDQIKVDAVSAAIANNTLNAYSSTILHTSDIGTNVQAYDTTILKSANIGSTVQGYDATTLKSAAIGVTVQGYDATTLKSAAIGVTVQGYDATTLKSAAIGVSIQAYDADLGLIAALTGAGILKRASGNTWSLDSGYYIPGDSATGAAQLPTGTTAQRPGTPSAGNIRYNATTGKFEGYGSAWGNIGGGAAIGDTAPTNPGSGDLWWNSTDGHLYVYFGSVWVDAFAGGEGQYLPLTGGTVSGNLAYTGTLTGGTGVINIGSGQIYKDASGNVGIGTTSPLSQVHSYKATNAVNFTAQVGSVYGYFGNDGTNLYLASNSGTTGVKLKVAYNAPDNSFIVDSSGNLGLNAIPSPWLSGRRAIQIGGFVSTLNLSAAISEIACNFYWNSSGSPIYQNNGPASFVNFNNSSSGGWAWNLAPSGTAANPISSWIQAMTLDASGRLGLGATNPSRNLDIDGGNSDAYIRLRSSSTSSSVASGILFRSGSSTSDATNMIRVNGDANNMQFYVNDAERARIDSAGTFVLNQGQIKFPATQVASSDANTLDDYEEGTWTPKLTDGVVTVNFGAGTYIKIGGMVYLDLNAYNQSFSGLGTGAFLLTNLPFSISQVFDAVLVGSVTDNFPVFAQGNSGVTAQLWHTTTGGVGVAALNKAAFALSTAGSIWGTIVYRAS